MVVNKRNQMEMAVGEFMTDQKTEKIGAKNSRIEIVFIIILLSLNLLTVAIFCISKGSMQSTLLFKSGHDSFMDFFNVLKYISTGDPYHYDSYNPLYEKQYPPLAYLLLYPFTGFYDYVSNSASSAIGNMKAMLSYAILFTAFLEIFGCLLYVLKDGRKSIRFLFGITLLTSGVSIFSLERGNLIYLSAICVGFFLIGYKNEKAWVRELSYIALAIAFALKCYPALFGVLLLYDKRYIDALKTAAYGLIFFFLPFLFFHGGFDNIWQMIRNLQENSSHYMYRDISYRFGFVPAAMLFDLPKSQITLVHYFSGLLIGVSALTAWSHKQSWKKVMLLTCSIILFPANCGYYCGLYLLVPITMFLNEKTHQTIDWMYLTLMIIVLNPFQYSIHGTLMTVPIANLALILLYLILLQESITLSIRNVKSRNLAPDKTIETHQ